MLHQIEVYSGGFILALIILYGTRNYLITLVAGFIAFCVFYFEFGFDDRNFHLSISSALHALGSACLLYIFPCVAAILLYVVVERPAKPSKQA